MDIETPSGKGAADENFPVASRLIAPALRSHVMCYYAFARGTDDIADNPELTPHEKLRRLDLCEQGLNPGATAPSISVRLRDSLAQTGVAHACATDLLIAFRRDATKLRYADWDDLLDYCRYSAQPVGRYLLQLHGEDPEANPQIYLMSDGLCAALQVLNHLQDLGEDRRRFDRIYLPGDWMAAEGVDATHLDVDQASPGLRRVIDRCLDGADVLLARAGPFASAIRDRRLAAEAAVVQRLAHRLSARLRREDPLAGRVKHSKVDLALGLLAGVVRLVHPGHGGGDR